MKRISFFYIFSVAGIIGLLFASVSYAANEKDLLALSIAAAQEAQQEVDIEAKIILDEDFAPEDFGLTGVGILPTSPFYFLKGIRRTVQSAFTFDPAAEVELKMRFSAEKLLEAKAVASVEGSSHDDITFALENFQGELARVNARVHDAKEVGDERALDLTKKLMDSTVKYQKSLGKIEKTLPPELFENIKLAKEKTSETFGGAFDLVEPEKAAQELTTVLEDQKGSEFKDFKNIEVLKEIEEKVPEQAKDAVRLAQEQALTRLQGELEKLQLAKRAVFEDFVREIGGSEARQLEIITDLGVLPLSEDLREVLVSVKEEALSKTDRRLQTLTQPQQEKFLEHLAQGEIKNVRVLKELENNVSKGVLAGITQAKERAKGDFVKKVKEGEFQEKEKQELFGELERSHDAGSLAVLDEIEALISPDKKAFFSELKQKAVVEIKRDIDRAGTASQRQVIFNALAGDHPEQFRAIDRFQKEVDVPFDFGSIWEGLRKAQVERFEMRAEFIKDKDRLARLEEDVGKQKEEFKEFRKFENLFRTRRDVFDSPERAQAQIREAEGRIAELEKLADSLPFDEALEEDGGFDPMLEEIERMLEVSERKLEDAREWLERGESGRAFGFANAASDIARQGIEMAQHFKSGKKIVRCPFFFPPPPNFCQNGRIVSDVDQNGCQLPPRCEFVERCPFPPPIPFNFCSNGRIVYEKSSQGCPLPPRCEEFRTCPLIVDPKPCAEGSYRDGFYKDGCFVYGECRPAEKEKPICQAFWSGFVWRPETNSCVKESTSGCSDPFVFHTQEECEKANKLTICPALPTVTSCPAGQKKVVTFSSPQCGTYYGCESEQPLGKPQCSDGIDNDNDGLIDYPKDTGCYGADDTTETPYVGGSCLSYTTQTSCQTSGCTWYANHHDGTHCDDAAHGQTAPPGGKPQCSDGVDNDNDGKTDYPADTSCYDATDNDEWYPSSTTTTKCTASTEATCNTDAACKWVSGFGCGVKAQCNDGIDNDNDGLIDYPKDTGCYDAFDNDETTGGTTACSPETCYDAKYCSDGIDNDNDGYIDSRDPGCGGTTGGYCGDKICNNGETTTSCSSDCGGGTTTSCSAALTALLGTGCHQMYTDSTGKAIYCNTEMTKSAKEGDTATIAGCTSSGTAGGYCGDNVCNNGETTTSCSADCGTTPTTKPQCSDGKDNDLDGIIDYPSDTGCYGADDNDEAMPATAGYCGDKACNNAETTTSCPADCGGATCGVPEACYDPKYCTDGIDNDSDGFIDSQDPGCGITAVSCGDKVCSSSESATSCPGDCGGAITNTCSTTPSVCTTEAACTGAAYFWCNGACYGTQASCPTSSTYCNFNNVCDSGETTALCPSDCGTTTTCPSGSYWDSATSSCKTSSTTAYICGNGVCDSGETSAICPADCGSTTITSSCGDHVCSSSETSATCPTDCGTTTTTTTTTTCASGQYWDEATHMCKTSTTGASLFAPFLKLFGF